MYKIWYRCFGNLYYAYQWRICMSANSMCGVWIILLSYSMVMANAEPVPRIGCSYEYAPVWQPLQERKRASHAFSTRQVVAGKISLSKKCNKRVELGQLKIRWLSNKNQNNTVIEKLQGALYKKCPLPGVHHVPSSNEVVCTGRYHIADGQWSKKEQTFIFRFAPFSLGIDTTLYLVLMLPYEIEQQLKNGEFIIEQIYLPEEFR